MTILQPAPVFLFSATYVGDLVLSTIALDIIARRRAPVTVVAAPVAAPLLAHDDRVAELRLVRSSNAVGWRAEVARHLMDARRRRSSVLNLEVYPPRWRFVRSFCALTGLPAAHLDLRRLAEDNQRSARGEPVSLPHRAHYYARAAGRFEEPPPFPRLAPDPRARDGVAARLAALAAPAPFYLVVVHPGSSEPGRRPPLALLGAILHGLAAEAPSRFVLVGTERERSLCAALAPALTPGVAIADWTGQLTLPELVALVATAKLFVGGDSGPLKIAEAVGTPTLSLWGPTGAGFAGPRGPVHRTIRFDSSATEGVSAACALLVPGAPTTGASGG